MQVQEKATTWFFVHFILFSSGPFMIEVLFILKEIPETQKPLNLERKPQSSLGSNSAEAYLESSWTSFPKLSKFLRFRCIMLNQNLITYIC